MCKVNIVDFEMLNSNILIFSLLLCLKTNKEVSKKIKSL